jgi:hypothetical protein
MAAIRTLSVLVVVSLFGVAACGSSAKKVDPVADLALAKRSVLTAADLPGYTGSPHTTNDDIPAADKKNFADCMKAPTTIFDDTPGAQKADSPDFAKGEAQISDSIEIDPKRSDIDNGFKTLSQPGTEPCLQKLFEAAISSGAAAGGAAGVTFGPATVSRFDVGVGQESVGYTLKISASAGADTAVFYIDLVFLPRDRAGLEFDFLNVTAPTDRTLLKSLVQKVYDRVGTSAA